MRRSSFYLVVSCIFFFLLVAGCSGPSLTKLKGSRYPVFGDDLDYKGLRNVLAQNLAFLGKLEPETRFTVADRSCTPADLIKAVTLLEEIIADSPDVLSLQARIKESFDLYQARGVSGWNPEKRMLVTGYYQPTFQGSLKPDSRYAYPLYRIPDDLVVQRKGTGKKVEAVGRLEEGKFVPYWSRKEIELHKVLEGQEIVWLTNPLDAFFLHVQGSGLITFPDGTVRGVHFAQRNGRPYSSIGKYMVDTGKISLESASLETIRNYIENHPEERNEILHHNQSFIFFHWTETQGAVGSIGRELTPGRSIAADREVFPPGSLAFLVSRQPSGKAYSKNSWKELRRFVAIQDTGSAIRGPGRVDIFWGSGESAGKAAGMMKEDGALFILLPKDKKT